MLYSLKRTQEGVLSRPDLRRRCKRCEVLGPKLILHDMQVSRSQPQHNSWHRTRRSKTKKTSRVLAVSVPVFWLLLVSRLLQCVNNNGEHPSSWTPIARYLPAVRAGLWTCCQSLGSDFSPRRSHALQLHIHHGTIPQSGRAGMCACVFLYYVNMSTNHSKQCQSEQYSAHVPL